MRHVDQVAALLFSEDPRQKVDKIVAQLVAESNARGGSLFAIRDEGLVPIVTRGIELGRLAKIGPTWTKARPMLKKGSVRSGGGVLVEVRSGPEAVGLLYLEAPQKFDEMDTEFLIALLGRALATTPSVPAASLDYVSEESESERQRAQLFSLLQRHEWNIAAVARLLGVTRPTVYLRLKRYEIKRKRVPKTLKKAPA